MDGSTVEISNFKALDPDDLDIAIEEFNKIYVPPTGEGLSKKEARSAVIVEVNKIIQRRNQKRLARSQAESELYREGSRKRPPFQLILLNEVYKKHLNDAVAILRARKGYESLLNAAGF